MIPMKIFARIKWTAVALCLLSAGVVSAHGSGGSIEVEQDGYLIDVSYSQEQITTGETTQFSFLLFDETKANEIDFTDVWVRLEQDNIIYFASLLARPEFGDTSMSFLFLNDGEYDLFVRYKNMDETVVERTIRVAVVQGEVGVAGATTTGFSSRVLAFVSAVSFILAVLIFGFFPLIPRYVKNASAKLAQLKQKRTQTEPEKPTQPAVTQTNEVPQKYGPKQLIKYGLVSLGVTAATFYVTSLLLGTATLPDWQMMVEQDAANGEVVSVVLTETGYEPSNLVIEKGTTIEFSTTAGRPHWPASNLHPSHAEYSEFDPLQPVESDESWSFTFTKEGEWGFHDHLRSYFSGKIEVVPAD